MSQVIHSANENHVNNSVLLRRQFRSSAHRNKGGDLSSFEATKTMSRFPVLAMVLLAMAAASILPTVEGAIALPEYNKTFTSMPALFGGVLSVNDSPVLAHLMIVKDRPLMCQSETGSNDEDGDHDWNNNDDGNETSSSTSTSSPSIPGQDMIHIRPPQDGLPVAVLVQRGDCTFWEKGQEAAKLGEAVKYVVVYDNEMSPDLVPMSSDVPSNMTMFFVSYMAGHELRDLILRKMMGGFPNDAESSGVLIELDGHAPPLPEYAGGPQLNLAAYFLAAMSGFLAFLVFFGCILILAQCGFITAHPDDRGRLVLFAGGARPHANGGGGSALGDMMRRNLLTREQVLSLEEIEFEVDRQVDQEGNVVENDGNAIADEESTACCCAICLDEFGDKEKLRRLPCQHRFHEDCLVPWLTERHSSCPLCKFDVMQHILNAEDGGNGNANKETQANRTERRNGSEVEAASGDADTPARDPSPHSLFWNRITFGGWTRVREDSNSDEEANQELGHNGVDTSEIEMENRSTLVTLSTTLGGGSSSSEQP